MTKRIVMISGWAHPGASLRPIAENLDPDFTTSLHPATNHIKLDEPVIVLGWSLGGMLAMELAARQPDHLTGLVLIAATPRFTFGPGLEFGTPEANLLDLMKQLKEDIKATLAGFISYAALPHRPKVHEMIQHFETLQNGLRYLLEKDLRPQVSDIKCPTLLIHGREDVVIPHAASEWLAARIKTSKLVSVTDMGHDLPLRRPDRIAREVRAFFS